MKARDIMVMNVITVGPEASVRRVADILFKNRISALPVVDEHGELIENRQRGRFGTTSRAGD